MLRNTNSNYRMLSEFKRENYRKKVYSKKRKINLLFLKHFQKSVIQSMFNIDKLRIRKSHFALVNGSSLEIVLEFKDKFDKEFVNDFIKKEIKTV